ncbi:putative thermostable nuclease [Staphylococcus phage CUB-EPI_14]|nr:putative thermostable nuclease [Staphylococcus phage CUB-EPI_14]
MVGVKVISIEDSLYYFKAKCYEVIDGDTAKFMIDVGFDTYRDKRVRFLNIDTPERGQDNYKEATDFVKERILNKEVIIRTYKADNFGRYLGEIWYYDEKHDKYRLLSNDLLDNGLEKPDSKWNNYISME